MCFIFLYSNCQQQPNLTACTTELFSSTYYSAQSLKFTPVSVL